MREYFEGLTAFLDSLLKPGEVYTCHVLAEDSDFVRLNKARIRQAGHVQQRELKLDLVEGQRHVAGNVTLSGNTHQDRQQLAELVNSLRAQRRHVPDDPYLNYARTVCSSEEQRASELPDSAAAIEQLLDLATDMDLVGIWSCGPLYAGFANSLGQRNWYQTASFSLDWSCYHGSDKAVKASHAGTIWEPETLVRKLEEVRTQLEIVRRPPKTIKPGRYRVYLAPSALQEILALMAWGGFGLKSQRTAQTPLIKMSSGDARLHSSITVKENHATGLAPRFTPEGFILPDAVELISRGEYRNALVTPRASMEYGATVNSGSEMPQSLDMGAGDIPKRELLERLDTGLYVNNLWYGNFSDRNDCRITAMTRFACFWVENGEIVAPVNVMRLDETIYRMLGDQLMGLTEEREFIPDPGTYQRRSIASIRLPGALVEDFTFTL